MMILDNNNDMRYLKTYYADYKKINVAFLAGSIAFFTLIAIFSISVSIMITLSYIPILSAKLITTVENLLPREISQYFILLINQINLPNSFFSLSIAFLSCIWSTSKVVKTLIRSFDEIYYFDNSAHKQNRFFSLLFTIGFEVLIIMIFLFSILENLITQYLFFNTYLPLFIFKIRSYISLIFPTTLLFLALITIYHFLTSIKTNFKSVVYGSLFSSIMSVALAKFFSLYTDVFSNFPTLLGSLGFIFVLLMWVYFNCLILLIGCYINSIAYKRNAQQQLNE